jgi:chromosome segregation ATPase
MNFIKPNYQSTLVDRMTSGIQSQPLQIPQQIPTVDYKQQYEELVRSHREKDELINNLKSQYSSVIGELNSKTKTLEEKTNIINNLENEKKKATEEIKNLQKTRDEISTEFKETKALAEKLKNDINVIKSDKSMMQDEKDKIIESIKREYSTTIQDLKSLKKEHDDVIEKLKIANDTKKVIVANQESIKKSVPEQEKQEKQEIIIENNVVDTTKPYDPKNPQIKLSNIKPTEKPKPLTSENAGSDVFSTVLMIAALVTGVYFIKRPH